MIKLATNRLMVGKIYDVVPLTVWDIITDTNRWPVWGPTVKDVQCADRFICKGSSGKVLTSFGIWLPFIVTEYEYCSHWGWEVASVKATGHRIQASDAGGCYLWFDMPILAAPYAIVCQIALVQIEKLLSEPK